MREMSDKGQELLEDLPSYCWDDPAIRGLMNALGNELQRLEDFIVGQAEEMQPQNATGRYLSFWERFLNLPVTPEGVPDTERREIVMAAIARDVGMGEGWSHLLDVAAGYASWKHRENADADGTYSPYDLDITGVSLLAGSWRTGIFRDMAKLTTPAHLRITEIEIAGDDVFRVGISEVGDEI